MHEVLAVPIKAPDGVPTLSEVARLLEERRYADAHAFAKRFAPDGRVWRLFTVPELPGFQIHEV